MNKQVIQWAEQLITDRNFVVLDTETHDKDNPYPIEISVIDPDGNTLFNQLIKLPEGKSINPEAMAVHGITPDMLEADGLTIDEVWSGLMTVLADKTVVAYNAEFDRSVILNAAPKHMVIPAMKWECAMLKYAEFIGEWNGYYRNYRRYSLSNAAQALKVEVKDAHRALGDAQMTLALIKKLATSTTKTKLMFAMTLNIDPRPKNTSTAKGISYVEKVRMLAIREMEKHKLERIETGDLRLTICFCRVRDGRADYDNMAKAIGDALKGTVFKDDRQIVQGRQDVIYGQKRGLIHILIYRVEQNPNTISFFGDRVQAWQDSHE